jgi:hypothetical protein
MMYAYRPPSSRAGNRQQRYLGTADRIMIMIGLAAVVGVIVSGVVTHGESVLSALNIAFGLKH